MATLSRPQIVLRSADEAWATHETVTILKAADVVDGTIIKSIAVDGTVTVAAEADITAGTVDVAYVVDDKDIVLAEDGAEVSIRAVKKLDRVILNGSAVKLGATVLTSAQVDLLAASGLVLDVQSV